MDKIAHSPVPRVLLLCSLFYLLLPFPEARGVMIDRVVAVVNNEVITLSELQEEAIKEKGPGGPEKERDVLNNLIGKRLQLQKAHQLGIRVTQEEVVAAIEDIKKRGLAGESMTIEKYKEDIRDQLLLSKLFIRDVKANIVIGEEEIERYYKEHQEDFVQPEEMRIRQILLRVPEKSDPVEIERIKEIAGEVLNHLRDGEDFAEMAKKYSQDSSAQRGGDLGFFRSDQLIKVLEEAITSLKEGEISEPVLSPLGFHIFKVEEKKGRSPVPLTEVRERIGEILIEERSERLYREYLRDLRNKAYIDIRL